MEDKEIRTEILNALREEYNKKPHGVVMKAKLLSELDISEIELERNIKYLSDKGLIDVKWFLGGTFYAKINSYGIDWLEQSMEEITETEGDALKHIFDETKESPVVFKPPIEIQESLTRFKRDYPDPTKVAFIMMQFGKTKAHDKIVNAIRSVLDSHGIRGVKADDKQYHDDLFYNVMTYLYGCGFGIAVFERIEAEDFNPNVSFEVGYMFALRKSVCLLKDKTLKTLHTDLVGKLYKVFDPQEPGKTIPDEISQWLSDKGIA